MSTTSSPRLAESGPVGAWDGFPAAQQPQWRHHPAHRRTALALRETEPLVTTAELASMRRSLAEVAAGRARVAQVGDCAESFYECTAGHTQAKMEVLDRVADRLAELTGQPVVRVGRIGGQFAKPRSAPTERHGDVELPAFRGHLVNSEVPTRAARQADPRRMLWAYEASARVLAGVRAYRESRAVSGPPGDGPWSSHEALVIDYESGLLRADRHAAPRAGADGALFLGSTHLPWIGERTRQPDSAHVQLLSAVSNPVGCKVGPGADPAAVTELCARLDPDRVPGRLVLIVRMGRSIGEVLPGLVGAVRRAGHPVVWLCDPMHGNTVRTAEGVKTRYLTDLATETRMFHEVLERQRQHPGGLHLEVAADGVTECVGGPVGSADMLAERYTTLCDPRLNLEQALELIDSVR